MGMDNRYGVLPVKLPQLSEMNFITKYGPNTVNEHTLYNLFHSKLVTDRTIFNKAQWQLLVERNTQLSNESVLDIIPDWEWIKDMDVKTIVYMATKDASDSFLTDGSIIV